jgi:hypothetical protein
MSPPQGKSGQQKKEAPPVDNERPSAGDDEGTATETSTSTSAAAAPLLSSASSVGGGEESTEKRGGGGGGGKPLPKQTGEQTWKDTEEQWVIDAIERLAATFGNIGCPEKMAKAIREGMPPLEPLEDDDNSFMEVHIVDKYPVPPRSAALDAIKREAATHWKQLPLQYRTDKEFVLTVLQRAPTLPPKSDFEGQFPNSLRSDRDVVLAFTARDDFAELRYERNLFVPDCLTNDKEVMLAYRRNVLITSRPCLRKTAIMNTWMTTMSMKHLEHWNKKKPSWVEALVYVVNKKSTFLSQIAKQLLCGFNDVMNSQRFLPFTLQHVSNA